MAAVQEEEQPFAAPTRVWKEVWGTRHEGEDLVVLEVEELSEPEAPATLAKAELKLHLEAQTLVLEGILAPERPLALCLVFGQVS